jgi:putative hydrolase of HD superfamily
MEENARTDILSSLPEEVRLLLKLEEIKDIERHNPLAYNSRKERVGEHSWYVAVAVPLLAPYSTTPIDVPRACLLAVVHDVVEAFVGDTFAFGPEVIDQHDREHAAMKRLRAESTSESIKHLVNLWDEYEAQDTPEARFVKGLDAFLPILLNFLNIKSSSWANEGVRADQVQKRLDRVRETIGTLALLNDRMIRQAAEDGDLL